MMYQVITAPVVNGWLRQPSILCCCWAGKLAPLCPKHTHRFHVSKSALLLFIPKLLEFSRYGFPAHFKHSNATAVKRQNCTEQLSSKPSNLIFIYVTSLKPNKYRLYRKHRELALKHLWPWTFLSHPLHLIKKNICFNLCTEPECCGLVRLPYLSY